MCGTDLLQRLVCHIFNESWCCLWFLLEGCFCVYHKILCRCRYDACPHSLRLKQEPKICVRVWLTEMRACFSYTVLAGSIVVEGLGGSAVTYYWGWAGPMGVRGPTVLRVFLYFSVISLFVDLQIEPFRSSQSYSVTESLFGLVSGFF
jgi:hypothetical protein